MKGKVSFIIGLIGFSVCFFLKEDEPRNTIFKISLGFVLGGVIDFVVFIIENKKHWGVLKTLIIKRNQPVRVTVAYLFRIEVFLSIIYFFLIVWQNTHCLLNVVIS